MAEKLSKLYVAHGRSDLAAISEQLLARYESIGAEAFTNLIETKYALIDRLAIESAARPFVLDAIQPSRDTYEKKQKVEVGSAGKPKEDPIDIEIRVKDHNGKSRVTKARPGTLMSEIVDWYGPRNGRAFVVDQVSGDRLSSDTTLRKLASNTGGPLDLKIVAK